MNNPFNLDYAELERLALTVKGVRQWYIAAKLARTTAYRYEKQDPEFKRIKDLVVHKKLGEGGGAKPWVPNLYRIQELAAAGLNKTEIAGVLKVAYSTYKAAQQITPGMKEAYDIGESEGVGQVKSVLYEMAVIDRNLDAVKTYLNRHTHATEERPDKVVIEVTYNKDYYKNKQGAT